MQTKILPVLVFFAAAIVVLQLNGCSLIGFGIGSAIDSRKSDTIFIPGWKVEAIKPGEQIRVILRDGKEVEGKYVGLNRVPPKEYAKRYADFRKQRQEELFLPALGDSITITMKSGAQGQRILSGFDHQYLATTLEGETDTSHAFASYIMSVRQMGDTTTGIVLLKKVDKIVDSDGNVVKGEDLQRLAFEGGIPLLSAIAIEHLLTTTQVAMNEVHQIEVPKKGSAKWTGLAIGAAIDVFIIVVALVSEDSEPEQTRADTGQIMCGCPFVYSFDGEKYVLDSETFGGSIFESAKRTDWSKLNHLKEVEGNCRLKITDELQETDYINEVRLLIVDHPKGTEVVPSFSGKLHVLSDPQIPINAVDLQGNNAFEFVKAKDDRFWLSNPFGRNPEIKAQARDGLILEFRWPPNAAFVKLALNVQNTLWAAHLQAKFLELQGSELQSWYELVNSSVEAREKFQKAFIREGMLLVKLWNGNSWQTSGFIWEVGANVFRDQIIWLDISDIPGEVLRVQLESTTGLWMINSVLADYTADLPLGTTELLLLEATDHLGRDLRQILKNTDDCYYEMFTGDWAELTFKVPPRKKGYERSFVLKSTGYYLINVSAEGEPQSDLIARLITEPAAFGQYTLRLLNGYVMSALEQLE